MNEYQKDMEDKLIFGSGLSEVNAEYIGAPGGEEALIEENRAKYYRSLNKGDVDYDTMEDTYHKLNDTIQHSVEQWFKSLTSDPTERPNKQEVKDSTWLVKELDRAFNEQYVREMQVCSKLSNVNNGQDSTFCFNNNSCKDKPAPNNPFEELAKKQQEFKQRVQGSKPSDFLEEHIKLADKLVNKSKTYRPLPDCLTIKESSIDGLGIFTTEKIYLLGVRDPHVWKTHTLLVYNDDNSNKAEELLRSALGGHLNHSNNPNCTLGKISSLVTGEK